MKENEPNIHLPAPSYWPIVLAFSFMLIAMGVVSSIFVSLAGDPDAGGFDRLDI